MSATTLRVPWHAATAAACTVISCAATSRAAEVDPIQSAGEALDQRMQIPWYDAETDALQPIAIREPWDISWNLSWLAEPVYWFALIGLALLLALAVWLIVRALRDRGPGHSREVVDDPLLVADRVEALPFLRDRSRSDLLGQARFYYEQGNYSEAIIYLFSYELVELDRSALIHLAKGKTNRQYLREALRVRPLAGLLERTMVTFEDVFFGRRALDRGGFEACWSQLDEFKQLVTTAQAPA